ncbi:hypothetical protein AMTR_s02072p00005900, partial [Amborella trichopoda]
MLLKQIVPLLNKQKHLDCFLAKPTAFDDGVIAKPSETSFVEQAKLSSFMSKE